MTALRDYYEETESDFTFDRASTNTSRAGENHGFKSDFRTGFRKLSPLKRQTGDDEGFIVIDRNRSFTGFAIGAPLSLVLWAGIFSLLYLIIR